MKQRQSRWRGLRMQLHAAAILFGLVLVGSTSVAQGIGLRFWDDANTNGSQCDVRNAFGTAQECTDDSYNVALNATNTSGVPRGPTTIHIIYTGIQPYEDASGNYILDADGKMQPDPSSAVNPDLANGNIQFNIVGDSWCPTYAGSPGINRKDSANGGHFASSSGTATGVSTGTEVTDFVINERDSDVVVPNGTPGSIPDASAGERMLSGTGRYRNSAYYCDSTTGAGFTSPITVRASDLIHQAGFPDTTWYVELVSRASESLNASGINSTNGNGQLVNCNNKFYDSSCKISSYCGQGGTHIVDDCQGISNKFRVSLNTSGAGSSHNYEVSGGAYAAGSGDYNVTFTNVGWNYDSSIVTDDSRHYSAVYRFGADCKVLNYGADYPARVILYDIDDAGGAHDTQKALLVKKGKNGDYYTLGAGGYTLSNNPGTLGAWHDRTNKYMADGVTPNPYYVANWSQSFGDTDTTAIDTYGNNAYLSINFKANAGDKYLLYMYDIRGDLVDQMGAPFDSVYSDNSCSASLRPTAKLSLASGYTKYVTGSVVHADATEQNTDYTRAGAAYRRYFWITGGTAADGSYNATAGDQLVGTTSCSAPSGSTGYIITKGEIDSGTNLKYVGPKGSPTDTADSSDGACTLLGTMTYQIQAADNGHYICTSMYLKPSTVDPSATTIGDATHPNPAVNCQQIANVASPYFSVLGGDTAVGAAFGDSCTPNMFTNGADNSIFADNAGGTSNPGGTYNGSTDQLAALTNGVIDGFVTGKYQSTSSPTYWYDSLKGGTAVSPNSSLLTFANYPPTGHYGSSLGLTNWCLPDYYSAAANDPGRVNIPSASKSMVQVSGPSPVIQNGKTNFYYDNATGPTGNPILLQLNAGAIPVNGKTTTVVVHGDVYLYGGAGSCTAPAQFIYSNSVAPPCTATAPSSVSNIPTFRVIASGNIYVDARVTELDGFYVAEGNSASYAQNAQPSSTSGSFITCAESPGGTSGGVPVGLSKTSNPVAVPTCSTPLKINGSVAAQLVVLNRTAGDIYGTAPATEAPAEIFQYNPQLWLPASTSGAGLGAWQAVTSLPPIL